MIAYVKGTVEDIAEDNAVVDVGGIGYNVRISADTAARLPGIGERVKLYTYTSVREDAIQLFGFLSKNDLDIFKKCITVSGIGPKGGLAILSVLDADSLRFAILSGDVKAITKAPGIGARTAERLILELKDKVSLEDAFEKRLENQAGAPVPTVENDAVSEAVQALTALGYSSADALKAVRKADIAEGMTTEEILKSALKNMSFL